VAGLALLGRHAERPAWTRPSKEASGWALGVAVAALLVVALAVDAPGRISDGWDEFKNGGNAGDGAGRLSSFAGESRYELWSSAADEFDSAPILGGGAGSFQYWWAREGGRETVRDAHSLYLQTLGELGIVGLLLLLGFFGTVFFAGLRNAFLTDAAERSRLAAALAAVAVFAITAMVDWMWQIPVLPVTMLLLASALVVGREATGPKPRLPLSWRIGVAIFSLGAIVLIAISLASLTLIRESEAAARGGDLTAALDDARSAQNVQPYAAAPRLQQALVLELLRDYGAAEAAARAATERERTNWRNWLVLSRVAAENGRPAISVAAFEKARSLNPEAQIFLR
ncbi:MAG: O-antigen ligase family protein, partial [Solirubrobacterales bacterium]